MRETCVDPEVYKLACSFVIDMVKGVSPPVLPSERAALDHRLAAAIQQAIEHEYEAIRQEWDGGPTR